MGCLRSIYPYPHGPNGLMWTFWTLIRFLFRSSSNPSFLDSPTAPRPPLIRPPGQYPIRMITSSGMDFIPLPTYTALPRILSLKLCFRDTSSTSFCHSDSDACFLAKGFLLPRFDKARFGDIWSFPCSRIFSWHQIRLQVPRSSLPHPISLACRYRSPASLLSELSDEPLVVVV